MVKKMERIKVSPENITALVEVTKEKYGSCCRSAIFEALNYTTNSARARFIRETALTSYGGKLIKEEKIV